MTPDASDWLKVAAPLQQCNATTTRQVTSAGFFSPTPVLRPRYSASDRSSIFFSRRFCARSRSASNRLRRCRLRPAWHARRRRSNCRQSRSAAFDPRPHPTHCAQSSGRGRAFEKCRLMSFDAGVAWHLTRDCCTSDFSQLACQPLLPQHAAALGRHRPGLSADPGPRNNAKNTDTILEHIREDLPRDFCVV